MAVGRVAQRVQQGSRALELVSVLYPQLGQRLERLVGEEDTEPRTHGLLRVGITRRVQHFDEVRTRRQKVVGGGVTRKLTCQEPVFSDHRFRREGAVEYLARVFTQCRRVLRIAQRD